MAILTISSVQRAALRALAHSLNPTVLIGTDGLSDAVLNEIDCHLNAHELIKVRIFGDDRQVRIELYEAICQKLNAAPIQKIGKLLVIWRPAPPAPYDEAAYTDGPAGKNAAGPAPRLVKIVKRNPNSIRRVKPKKVVVLGNQRVTSGGLIKKVKKRTLSKKMLAK